MQNLPKNYEHILTEEKWYNHWLLHKYFESQPTDSPKYSIVIPPQMLQAFYTWDIA